MVVKPSSWSILSSLIMTHAFLTLVSRHGRTNAFHLTRAFSTITATTSATTRTSILRSSSPLMTVPTTDSRRIHTNWHGRCVRPSTTNSWYSTGSSCKYWTTIIKRQQLQQARSMSTVEEEKDLDEALDSILGENVAKYDAVDIARNNKNDRNGKDESKHNDEEDDEDHTKRSSVSPPSSQDFKDPKFLSTNNPRWNAAGMSQAVIDILSAKGITHLTPVQAEAFDPIMNRRDVIGRSRTGTGKTLAFGIPSMTRLLDWMDTNHNKRDARTGRLKQGRLVSMVVLCPTRELARQVSDELREVGTELGLTVECFHGGVSYGPQANALRLGTDVLVGTPGRVIDHMDKGNLDLSQCDITVLDEADEMLNMGFADDVEKVLEGVGSANPEKTQCLLFSATTPSWVNQIGRRYQQDVLAIDSTADQGGARVATTVRHTAVQLPPGQEAKVAVLEDIIAVHISRDTKTVVKQEEMSVEDEEVNPIAAAARAKKAKHHNTMQQKIFGKTIVFVDTKRLADELVSGGVFKSLTAQALHGDVGQQQRDSTLNAFRSGAFNVLVATDVAARGIDIKDVDLVIQFDPPRDVDTYVHRSGRTGRAGQSGVSVLMFNHHQGRDIVKIERDLGHGFKFDLIGPPSTEAALTAAARTSAMACMSIPDETAKYFRDSAADLLEEYDNPEDIVARCLAAISRRANEVQSRSLLTGELGKVTVEMKAKKGNVAPSAVMFTVGKLSRLSQTVGGEAAFTSDIGKIQANPETGSCYFDMNVEEAKKLMEFSQNEDAGGSKFSLVKEIEVNREDFFSNDRRGSPQRRGGWNDRNGGGGGRGGGRYSRDSYGDRNNNSRGNSYGRDNSYTGNSNRNDRDGRRDYEGGRGSGRSGARNSSRGGSSGGYQNRGRGKY